MSYATFDRVAREWGESMWTHRDEFKLAVVDSLLRQIAAAERRPQGGIVKARGLILVGDEPIEIVRTR